MSQQVGLAVRDAVPEDAEAIEAVRIGAWKAAYRDLLPVEYLDALDPTAGVARRRGWLADPPARGGCLVTEARGRIVGFVNFGPSRDEGGEATGEVYAIYVEGRYWGTGRGRALWLEARRRLADAGFRRVTLWTLAGNTRAEAFYVAAGFHLDGAEKVDECSATEGAPPVRLEEVRYRLDLESRGPTSP